MASIKKAMENKAKDTCKNQSENKKSKNLFTMRRKYYSAAKERKVGNQKDYKNKPIILR